LGFGAFLHNATLTRLGGFVGLLCGSLAMYGSFAIVTNATFEKALLPLGARN
jgi:succinate-acetate transporter protein